jgi:hypothetical protein
MSVDSYPGRPSPPSSLNGGSTLSMAELSAHDLGLSGPPSDRPAPYAGQSGVTQSPSQGSQALPGMTGQSGKGIRQSVPLANHTTTQVGPFEAPKSTCDRPNTEGRHKDSWPPKP